MVVVYKFTKQDSVRDTFYFFQFLAPPKKMPNNYPIIEHSSSAGGRALDSTHQTFKWSDKFMIKLREKSKYFL